MMGTIIKPTYKTNARTTGATVVAGKAEDGWGALCESHGTFAPQVTRARAEAAVSHPENWCPGCHRDYLRRRNRRKAS